MSDVRGVDVVGLLSPPWALPRIHKGEAAKEALSVQLSLITKSVDYWTIGN
jgi:hypothetical protein